jgi:hypothetical protein
MQNFRTIVGTIPLAFGGMCVALLVGCGGGASPATGSYGGARYAEGRAAAQSDAPTAYESPGAQRASASSPAPPSAGYGGDSAYQPQPSAQAPSERPGLGTEWGESRESRIYNMSFVRASSQPFAVLSVNYNDRAGVNSLISFHERNGTLTRAHVLETQEVSMSIRDERDNAFETLRLGDKSYVIGQAGDRYSIVLTNRTGRRFEAVATVDGLDVINGRTGAMGNRGYILMPYATVEIDGFRQSQDTVAAFRFGAVGDSYAAQKGSDRNVGVIGVALFGEQSSYPAPDDHDTRVRDRANPFPADPRYAQPPRRW